VVRIFSILDWDMHPWTLGGAANKIANREPGYRLKNCLDVRDFLTPATVAHLIKQLAHLKDGVGTVNICSGIPTTVGDAVKQMLLARNLRVAEESFEYKNSSNPYIVGNPTKLSKLLPDVEIKWSRAGVIEHNSITEIRK